MKILRKVLPIALVICLMTAMSVTAFAWSHGTIVNINGGSYVEVIGQGRCTNKSIMLTISGNNPAHHNDVRMKDSYGNIVWERYGAVGTNGCKTFQCGGNVYSVEVRVGAKNIIGDLFIPKTGACLVNW